MKFIKKLTAAACALAFSASLVSGAGAAYISEAPSKSADILYTLGLIQGSDKGYELERQPTRAEALAFILRLNGLEEDVLAGTYSQPFTDVPAWAENYVAFGYALGLVNGRTSRLFAPYAPVSENDFSTMLLRSFGYNDTLGDFSWGRAAEFAARLGFIERDGDGYFTRGDMFTAAVKALSHSVKGSSEPLITTLSRSGAVDASVASAVGYPLGRALSGAEISEMCSSAVFTMYYYDSVAGFISDKPVGYSSAFFITPGGVAVSNYHPFAEASIACAVLNNGEKYLLDKILFFDSKLDAAVFSIKTTAFGGVAVSAFPYLDVMGCESVRNGDAVYAIGSPLGLNDCISYGIVSNRNRSVEGFSSPMIQNTAPISQGSSGGALVNAFGKAVGLTSAGFVYGQNMNLAVPLDFLSGLDLTGPGCSILEMRGIVDEQAEKEAAEAAKAAQEGANAENADQAPSGE